MAEEQVSIGKQMNDANLGAIIKNIAVNIAQAQFELDQVSMRIAQMMSGKYEEPGVDGEGKPTTVEKNAYIQFDGKKYSMLELGFTPTFYQFVDTIIEIKLSMNMSTEETKSDVSATVTASADAKGSLGFFSASASMNMTASLVSASYASKYQYSAEGSSLVRTKLVPVPAPAILEARIRAIVDRESKAIRSGDDATPQESVNPITS